MHGANLDNVSYFFALEDAISASSRHAGYVEEFSTVDHMIVCLMSVAVNLTCINRPTFASRDTYTLGFDLEAETAFIFPQRCCHPGFHPGRCDLSGVVELM